MERFFTEGDDFYASAISAIRGAQDSVYLEMYIFQDDEIGRRFAAALVERARAGCKVIVIYDRVGSFATPEKFWQTLREGGVLVYAYHPTRLNPRRPGFNIIQRIRNWLQFLRRAFLRRNHRKTLIVDERFAYTGGFNIMRECSREIVGVSRWLDTMYMTDRPVLTHALQTYFRDSLRRIYNARRETGEFVKPIRKRVREAILYPARAARDLPGLMPVLRKKKRGLPRGYVRMTIPRALKKLMHHSQRRIWLTYPYFVPYGAILRLLFRKAGGRRLDRIRHVERPTAVVDVRVYLSMVSDLPWMRDMTLLMAAILRRRGVRIYLFHGRETPQMEARFCHAKVALIDDWVGVGASNFDRRSFILNLELLLLRHGAPYQSDVERFFEFLERHSVLLDESNQNEFRAGWRAYALYPFRRWI